MGHHRCDGRSLSYFYEGFGDTHPVEPIDENHQACDETAGEFHTCLEWHIGHRKKAIYTNLRAEEFDTTGEKWYHAVYRYIAEYRQNEPNNLNVVYLKTEITANKDSVPNPTTQDNSLSRRIEYEYTVEYNGAGNVDVTSNEENWIKVSLEGAHPPQAMVHFPDLATLLNPPPGSGQDPQNPLMTANPYVNLDNVKALDEANP